jgi:hypothetical protein
MPRGTIPNLTTAHPLRPGASCWGPDPLCCRNGLASCSCEAPCCACACCCNCCCCCACCCTCCCCCWGAAAACSVRSSSAASLGLWPESPSRGMVGACRITSGRHLQPAIGAAHAISQPSSSSRRVGRRHLAGRQPKKRGWLGRQLKHAYSCCLQQCTLGPCFPGVLLVARAWLPMQGAGTQEAVGLPSAMGAILAQSIAGTAALQHIARLQQSARRAAQARALVCTSQILS